MEPATSTTTPPRNSKKNVKFSSENIEPLSVVAESSVMESMDSDPFDQLGRKPPTPQPSDITPTPQSTNATPPPTNDDPFAQLAALSPSAIPRTRSAIRPKLKFHPAGQKAAPTQKIIEENNEILPSGKRTTNLAIPIDPRTQREQINPSTHADGSRLPFNMKKEDISGRYFVDVSDDIYTAQPLHLNVSTHPDDVLRRCGLIRQVGSYGFSQAECLFDETTMRWREIKTNTPILGKSDNFFDRMDYVPSGIINVVGTLTMKDFESKEEQLKKDRVRAESQKELHSFKSMLAKRKRKEHAAMAPANAASQHISGRHGASLSGQQSSIIEAPKSLQSMLAPASRWLYPSGGPNSNINFSVSPSDNMASPSPSRQRSEGNIIDSSLPTATKRPLDPLTVVQAANEELFSTGNKGYFELNPLVDTDDGSIEMMIDIGDPSSEFLSKLEQLKYIRHYLTRGIVGAASSSKASILCGGSDDLPRLLGIGYFGLLDRVGTKLLRVSQVPTQLIGINPRILEPQVDIRFSHHILLETDGGHAVERQKGTDLLFCNVCRDGKIEEGHAYRYCPGHPLYEKKYASRGVEETTNNPLPEEFLRFKQGLLETLHRGYQRQSNVLSLEKKAEPPNRESVPICLVLFGGGEVSKRETFLAVAKGWPIVIVEGSGGYADLLCSIQSKISKIAPDAGEDEVRAMLGAIDAQTSEIINNGKLIWIPPGTPLPHFQRLVQNALKGDEILFKGWRIYALWRANERQWGYYYQVVQMLMLLLSIAATTVSVIQTFIVLLFQFQELNWAEEFRGGQVRSENKYQYLLYYTCQWLVIGLPILLTLLHAIYQRMNPWSKWSSLRIANQSLLREIYMYRTRTCGYSTHAIRQNKRKRKLESEKLFTDGGTSQAHKKRSEGEGAGKQSNTATNSSSNMAGEKADEESGIIGDIPIVEPYESREELLGLMINRIQKDLAASQVKAVTLGDATSAVPPQNIVDIGDPGITDLTPDEYVKYRLLHAKNEHAAKAEGSDGLLGVVTTFTYLWGAIGTAMAALSAYGLGYLQAWVAFTTMMVSSLNRFIDYSRLGVLTELSNTTVHHLSDVEGWWSAIGAQADNASNRNKLVRETEGILQQELEGWARQLQKGQEELQKAMQDAKKAKEEEKAQEQGEKAEEVRALKELGCETFDIQGVTAALGDPKGVGGQNLKRQLLGINDKLGNVIKPAVPEAALELEAETVERVAAGQESAAITALEAVEEMPSMAFTGTNSSEALTNKLQSEVVDGAAKASVVLHDPLLRKHFITTYIEILDIRNCSPFIVSVILEKFSPDASKTIQQLLGPKEVLELSKQLVLKSIMEEIARRVPQVVIPERLYEVFLAQIVAIQDGGFDVIVYDTLCLLVKHPDIKRMVLDAGEQLTLKLFTEPLKMLNGDFLVIFKLFEMLCAALATIEMHLEFLLSGESCLQLLAGMQSLRTLMATQQLHTLTREEILVHFHPEARALFAEVSDLQLYYHIESLNLGTAAARCFEQLRYKARFAKIMEKGGMLHDPLLQEQLIVASEKISQGELNRMDKGEIMRILRGQAIMQSEASNQIARIQEDDLYYILSKVQALYATSYDPCIIDRLGDVFSALDLRNLLDVQAKQILVRYIGSLPDVIDIHAFSKEYLLSIVPIESTREVFKVIDDSQLHDLFLTLKDIIEMPHYQVIWNDVASQNVNATKREIIDRIHPFLQQRLIFIVSYLGKKDLHRIEDCEKMESALGILGDAMLAEALIPVTRNLHSQVEYCVEFSELIGDLYVATRDISADVIWSKFESLWCDGFTEEVSEPLRMLLHEHYWGNIDILLGQDLLGFESKNEQTLMDLLGFTPELGLQAKNAWDMITTSMPMFFAEVCQSRDQLFSALAQSAAVFFIAEMPYQVFVEIAQWIRQFDLRDVFSNSRLRIKLPILMAMLSLSLGEKETRNSVFRFATPECVTNVRDFEEKDILCGRRELLECGASLPDNVQDFFDEVLEQIRVLRDAQVRRLIQVSHYVLQQTKTGNLLCSWLQGLREGESSSQDVFQVVESTTFRTYHVSYNLMTLLRGDAQRMKELFANFNIQQYERMPAQEKQIRLQKAIPDEKLVEDLLKFSPVQLKQIFMMLRHTNSFVEGMKSQYAHVAKQWSSTFKRLGDSQMTQFGAGKAVYDF